MKPCATPIPLCFGGNYKISPSIAIHCYSAETVGRAKYRDAEQAFAKREQDILALPNNVQFLLESDQGRNEDKLVIQFPTHPDAAATSKEMVKTIDLKHAQRIGAGVEEALNNWFGLWTCLQAKSQFDKAFPHIQISDSLFLDRYQQVTHRQTSAFIQYLDILIKVCSEVFAQPFPEGFILNITPSGDSKTKLYAMENVSLSVINRYGLKGKVNMPPLRLDFLENNNTFNGEALQNSLRESLTQIKGQTEAWVELFKPGSQHQSDAQKPL